MGYSLSWLAFKNLPPDVGLARLGLTATDRLAEYARESVSGQPLPDGWFLLVMKGADHPLISESFLAALSAGSAVIACSVEEHLMCSSAEGWDSGQRRWRVEHDAQQSRRHLETSGALPAAYAGVLRQAQEAQDAEDANQAEVDFFFEVPLHLARDATSFKHDEEIPNVKYDAFQVYQSASRSPDRKSVV